jgi:hypothetical protein
MQQFSTLQWLTRCALAASAVLLGCLLVTGWIGTRLQQPAATTRDGSLVTLNRYVQEPTPELVLVGSSVAWRLKEEYFALGGVPGGVRNLALAGGSPVTGLEIVARQRRLPKIVLIETNVLSRAVDDGLVARFSGGEHSAPLLLRPVRTAVAAFESWNHAPPEPARARAALEQLLAQPPSGFDNRLYLERAVREMNSEDPTRAARGNVIELTRLIGDIERRGARAFLIEIPFSPEVEVSRAVRITKEVAREAFPDRTQWLAINPPLPELRWADGVHLDERSAVLVVRSIERALAQRATPGSNP